MPGKQKLVSSLAVRPSVRGRLAKKQSIEINWEDDADLAFEERTTDVRMLTRAEVKHGMIVPAYFYGLMENAIAHRESRTRSEHRRAMAKLFAKFSAVAETNPFAQFPAKRDEAFLATPSQENFEFADPFLKWHMAQDAVKYRRSHFAYV